MVCLYSCKKKNKDQLLLMFKTNHKPLTKFTSNSGNIVIESKKNVMILNYKF